MCIRDRSKKFLSPSDKVLILDDFLANGKAMKGLQMPMPPTVAPACAQTSSRPFMALPLARKSSRISTLSEGERNFLDSVMS